MPIITITGGINTSREPRSSVPRKPKTLWRMFEFCE
jgi:hypothetical protein